MIQTWRTSTASQVLLGETFNKLVVNFPLVAIQRPTHRTLLETVQGLFNINPTQRLLLTMLSNKLRPFLVRLPSLDLVVTLNLSRPSPFPRFGTRISVRAVVTSYAIHLFTINLDSI
jgi:hypothetical protein